jgi:hypothetical protein
MFMPTSHIQIKPKYLADIVRIKPRIYKQSISPWHQGMGLGWPAKMEFQTKIQMKLKDPLIHHHGSQWQAGSSNGCRYLGWRGGQEMAACVASNVLGQWHTRPMPQSSQPPLRPGSNKSLYLPYSMASNKRSPQPDTLGSSSTYHTTWHQTNTAHNIKYSDLQEVISKYLPPLLCEMRMWIWVTCPSQYHQHDTSCCCIVSRLRRQ